MLSAEQVKAKLEVMSRTSSAKSDPKFNSSSVCLPHLSWVQQGKIVSEPLVCFSSAPVSSLPVLSVPACHGKKMRQK